MEKRILITGIAGFIGYHLALYLKTRGDFVIGVDNFNTYYEVKLKEDRSLQLKKEGIEITRGDICDCNLLKQILLDHGITHVLHLAAQAGVRHSLSAPNDYVTANLSGFVSILEACRSFQGIKLIYASSSSVYGLNEKIPFSIEDATDRPANLYGATKKANEMMAYAYHHLYGLCVTGLRYFTVYGPWGRPDMAYYRFANLIMQSLPIPIFNFGAMRRDFTYIGDIVRGTAAAIDLGADCEIFNLGNNSSIDLLHLIDLIEQKLGKTTEKIMLPMPLGEIKETYADIEKSAALLNFRPAVALEEGISLFIDWYKSYARFIN